MTKIWTLVTKLASGHRLFRDEAGKLALADNSGATPDLTEDGPLYLTGDAEIGPYPQHHVTVDVGGGLYVGVMLADVPALIDVGIHVRDGNLKPTALVWTAVLAKLEQQKAYLGRKTTARELAEAFGVQEFTEPDPEDLVALVQADVDGDHFLTMLGNLESVNTTLHEELESNRLNLKPLWVVDLDTGVHHAITQTVTYTFGGGDVA